MPMEAAPRARSCRVRGLSTFDRMRQPQIHFYLFYLKKAVGEKLIYSNLVSASFFRTTFGAADFKSQLFNKQFSIYRLFTRNASMNSNYYHHLELSISQEAHHDLKPQSSESRKIRGEADAISTQDRFSKFEFSHLFLRC